MLVAQVIALYHGGGPLPVLNDAEYKDIIRSLRHRVPSILGLGTARQPRAIVLVTAHWTTETAAVSSAAKHDLVYDYYGFPPESYRLQYPAPGEPAVARRVKEAFDAAGVPARLDAGRGWDHGVFIPLLLVRPEADVPVVQVSVLASEDADAHLRMGAALASLREDNVAVVGSGFASLHNLDTMSALRDGSPARAAVRARSDAWNAALVDAVAAPRAADRRAALAAWRRMPHADEMHPPRGGEHFMPLLVCAGAAADGEETHMYKDSFLGVDIHFLLGRHAGCLREGREVSCESRRVSRAL